MGLSYSDAVKLGMGHLHPAVCGGKSKERELLDRLAIPVLQSHTPNDGMNKLERDFAGRLQSSHLIRQWAREPMTFRLAGRTRYTPDFGVWPHPASDWRFTLCEVKGFMRDDASVKIKVAADLFPQFRWLLVYRDGRHSWEVRNVDRNGIGREPITVPWING